MRLEIEQTEIITELDGVPTRVWIGRSEDDTPCFVFVHGIAVGELGQKEFERELYQMPQPAKRKGESEWLSLIYE